MLPNPLYAKESSEFWALVRSSSEKFGYSKRKDNLLKRFSIEDLDVFKERFPIDSKLCKTVVDYLNFRAEVLEKKVLPNLMDRLEAKKEFEKLLGKYKPKFPLVMNKQKGEKRHYNYLSCMVNIIAEKLLADKPCNFSPRGLCVLTDKEGRPIKVLSRWLDGAYPDVINPVAIWEIKEYYGTTTFGSRVADGVYETQLDGYEINEAEKISNKRIKHYLFVDDRRTWWDMGKSYLCRMIDMLHMGFVDEIIFGREVVTRWPEIVRSWDCESPSK